MERRHHPHEEEHRPVHNPGLRSGVEGGEHVHHEKTSVLKKVKAKARKIKDTITQHGHSHDHEAHAHDEIHARHHDMEDSDEEDDDNEMEEDPEIHGAPRAHPITAPVAAGHHGTNSIHDVTLGGAHRTTAPVTIGRHGTSSNQHDDVYGSGAHETTTATPNVAVGHHGTGSIPRDAKLGGAHGTGSAVAPVAVGRHGTSMAQHGLGGAHGTTTDATPLAVEHHRTDANIGLNKEAHNLTDHRSFTPGQVGVSKHDGVTFGGSQTPHDVGGRATQPAGDHSLGYAGAHHQTNLPISSGMGTVKQQQEVCPQKTGILDKQTALEPDPPAPRWDRQPDNYQSKVKDPTGRGCEEIGITPTICSLDKMKTCDDIKQRNVKTSPRQKEGLLEPNAGLADKNRSQQVYSGTGSHDQFSPEPISHPLAQHGSSHTADKVSSANSVISDKAIQAKNAVASKLDYVGGEGAHQKAITPSHGREFEDEKTSSSPSVTDYGKKVASTVYEKVAGAGGAVMSKMPGSQHEPKAEAEAEAEPAYDKGVSTKEYIAEKVSPGEEDKALSGVISGALHKGRGDDKDEDEEDEHKKEEGRGKVTVSAKVARQLGGGEPEEGPRSEEDLGPGVSGPAGGAMVNKLRDTFTSWLGIGGEAEEPSSLVWHDIPKDAKEADQPEKERAGD